MRSNGKALATPTTSVTIPNYLRTTYWWAYLHPQGVRLFERRWLVNLILFGNYRRLSNEVIDLLSKNSRASTLQIACVYGDLTQRLAQLFSREGQLDVVDVAPIQLANLRNKLGREHTVGLHLYDSTRLGMPDNSYHSSLLFFLLHEQPWQERIETLSEALRVTRPGGQLVIIDYHLPRRWSPLRYLLSPLLHWLEPFAHDLWKHDIRQWLPAEISDAHIQKQTFFGSLYQKLVVTLPE